MAFQSLLYLYSFGRLKPVRKQQKAKATATLWCGLEIGRLLVCLLARTQDTEGG